MLNRKLHIIEYRPEHGRYFNGESIINSINLWKEQNPNFRIEKYNPIISDGFHMIYITYIEINSRNLMTEKK